MPSQRVDGVVAGVFRDEEEAAEAVRKLVDADFNALEELSVIASHQREHQEVPVTLEPEVVRGAELGATIGAVLAAAGVTMAGLTFGPLSLVAAGPVLVALEAAYAGGATGFALGALMGLGLWKEEAEFHATHIHNGVVWVGVHAEGKRADEARRILTESGAAHFMD